MSPDDHEITLRAVALAASKLRALRTQDARELADILETDALPVLRAAPALADALEEALQLQGTVETAHGSFYGSVYGAPPATLRWMESARAALAQARRAGEGG